MKIRHLVITAGVLALGLATWNTPSKAQGPLWDRVNVNLPYTITIGDHVLQPGDYVIQQLDSPSGGSRVLLIYSDNGMRFETSAMTIPVLDPNTARDTKVILHHFGPDYYFDKIWIQGKDYGYEFPLPNSVKERQKERMEPVSVAATYQSIPAETKTETATTSKQTTTTQQSTAQTATTQQQTTTAQQQTTTAQATTSQSTMQAQTAPPAATTPATPMPENNTANREMPSTMPSTSAGWLMMLLSGGALSGLGMQLRRRR